MSSLKARAGRLAVASALFALVGCTHYYHQAQATDPHATLTFEKTEQWGYAYPYRLNGRRPSWTDFRHTARIGVGTMRLEIAEQGGEGTLATPGPRFICELSFEAEAGRQYRVTEAWDENGFLYVVAADTGTKLADCKAREKGEGAIVIRDEAPVYRKKRGSEVGWRLKGGDAVAGVSISEEWHFEEESGRVAVVFLGGTAGTPPSGWMNLVDLERFTYFFCNYDPVVEKLPPIWSSWDWVTLFNRSPGYPFTHEKNREWIACFREARDAKLKELRAAWKAK